jgi:membrane protein YdbS with pleckstrin-like domain
MDKNTSSSGLGLSTVLTIIFVVLKLVGVIAWSWWWVLSPILIDIGLTIIVLVIYAIYVAHENKRNNKWRF